MQDDLYHAWLEQKREPPVNSSFSSNVMKTLRQTEGSGAGLRCGWVSIVANHPIGKTAAVAAAVSAALARAALVALVFLT